jgi:hypothetical protein
MIHTVSGPTASPGGSDICSYVRGAAVLLRARGTRVTPRSVGSLARLARSFAREGMGRFEALQAAAVLSIRRR